jgi:hypothetical protein
MENTNSKVGALTAEFSDLHVPLPLCGYYCTIIMAISYYHVKTVDTGNYVSLYRLAAVQPPQGLFLLLGIC